MNHLRLLGPPQLETPSGSFAPDRRMAGVLAYLALEGATHKYKLAGFLWPDAEETTARNNMRQLLRRVRTNANDIVMGEDLIELRPELEVDVQKLSYLETPSLENLKQDVELLAGLEYDDTYEFAEWLAGTREELKDLRARSARAEAERLEQLGNHKYALEYAQVWTRLEPLSEEAHRLVMRLLYLMGDRGAALASFERLKKSLREDLGADPLPETLELARMLERGSELAGTKPRPKENLLPTSILRPPVLAGREREWALMEEAWERGQVIYLEGEPGVGKTRLALDFAQSKGKVFHFRARPGDAGIPLATQARAIREMIEQDPKMLTHMPQWARRELARLLPELSEGEVLPPLNSQADKLRFFEAVSEAVLAREPVITVADDVQFSDAATVESTGYVMNKFASRAESDKPRIINVFRRGELLPEIEAGMNQGIELGLLAKVSLEPLEPEAIGTLLDGLGLPDGEGLSLGLSRYTGGNPMFILETLKHLIETGTLEQGLPSRLAPPGKVAALIGRRLGRLSPNALNLARAAAVAKTSFDMGLAAAVLERPAMELAEAHAELEAAQVLRGNAFTHDLVFEATLAGIPGAVRQVLHGSTARYLEGKEANPALIAQHYQEAGDGDKGAEWLIKAAEKAKGLGLYTEEMELLERAIKLATSKALRLEAQWMLSDTLGPLGKVEESIELARQVLLEADEPRIKQRALSILQNMYQGLGRYQEAEGYIAQALELAEQLGEADRADAMRFYKARVLRHRGDYSGAVELLERVLPRYGGSGVTSSDQIQALTLLGNTYNLLGQHTEADPILCRTFRLSQDDVGPALRILAASHLLYHLICTGQPEELLPDAEGLLELGDYPIADHLRGNLGLAYSRLGRKTEAIRHYRILAEKAFDPNYRCIAWAALSGLEAENSEAAINRAKELLPQAGAITSRFAVAQAALLHGSEAQQAWGLGELESLDPATLSWLSQEEYERLRGLK